MASSITRKMGSSKEESMRPEIIAAYALFTIAGGTVWYLVADGEFSSILTLSVLMQCLAASLLALQMHITGSAVGVSARSVALDTLAVLCRLSSTLWLNGYLPVDASGDYVFQLIDIASVAIFLYVLHRALVVQRYSYQEDEDSLPIVPVIVGTLVLAGALHGDMNGRPVFDSLWMAGLFLSVVAVLPQLWMITRSGGKVEPLTSHYIAAMAASRALSGIFMWHARNDITCAPWVEGFNHASWTILGAHTLHLLLLADFGYCYLKAVLQQGLAVRMDLAESCGV